MDCGPEPTAGLGPVSERPTKPASAHKPCSPASPGRPVWRAAKPRPGAAARAGPGCPERGAANSGTLPPQLGGEQITPGTDCRRWDETSAQKPRDAEGGPREPSQVHTALRARGGLGGLGEAPHVVVTQKQPRKHLPGKSRPAAQGGTGTESPAVIPGTSRDWLHCIYAETLWSSCENKRA